MKSHKGMHRFMLIFISFFLVCIAFQNCSPGFEPLYSQDDPIKILSENRTIASTSIRPAEGDQQISLEPSSTPLLRKGDMGPLVVRMRSTFGTLNVGEIYLYYHDAGAGLDHLSHLKPGGNSAIYKNTSLDFNRGTRNLWGLLLRENSDKKCFELNGVCQVDVLGNLFQVNPSVFKSRFDGSIDSIIQSIPGKIRRAYGNDLSESCPTNANIKLRYLAIRDLAMTTKFGARLLPFVYDSTKRSALRQSLFDARTVLLDLPPQLLIHSSYKECFGEIEMQTLQMVLIGLRDLAEATGTEINNAYLQKSWTEYVNSGLLTNMRKNVLEQSITVPNSFAQYLITTTIFQNNGIDAIQGDFTSLGLDRLFSQQSLIGPLQAGCNGYLMTYGGWWHVAGADCAQKMGYHMFLTEGLLGLLEYIKPMCQHPYWSSACQNLPYNLAAALSWIIRVQREDGAIFDQAPGSTPEAPTVWGTSIGIAMSSKILKSLRQNGFADSTEIKANFDGSTLKLVSIEALVDKAVLYDLETQNLGTEYLGDFLSYKVYKMSGQSL